MRRRLTRTVTISDVAAASGVSIGTVSNYLNRPEIVAPQTRGKIESAIDDLGWVPNIAVRTLRRGYSELIGLVVPDMNNPFFTDVARGVEQAATTAGYTVIICNSDHDADREDRYLATLAEHRVAGMLITPVSDFHDEQYLALNKKYDGRLVLLAQPRRRQIAGLSSVGVDDTYGGRLLGEHLLALGHRHICLVHGAAALRQETFERLDGFRTAVLAQRSTPALELVEIVTDNMHVGDGVEAARRMLEMTPRPTAVFLANDLLAVGMLKALDRAGLRVPADISVVGYDDLELAEVTSPALTTVAQPRFDMGTAAVTLLLERLRMGEGSDREIFFTPRLVVRESTAAAPLRRDEALPT